MFINRLLTISLLFCVLFAFQGCASTPTGGFRIKAGSGQEYYARSVSFVGKKGSMTFNMRDWNAEDFNKLELNYLENGGGMGYGTLSFLSTTNNKRINLDHDFRVEVISEEEFLISNPTKHKKATSKALHTEKDSNLIKSAAKGDLEQVRFLLANGADVNERRENGATALMIVSQKGFTEVVKELLTKGADVNQKASNGWTALMVASVNGHREVVSQLLEKGADVNIQANNGVTALMVASRKGHIGVVKELLANGADKDMTAHDGQTAITAATQKGHTEVARLLRESAVTSHAADTSSTKAALEKEVTELLHYLAAPVVGVKDGEDLLNAVRGTGATFNWQGKQVTEEEFERIVNTMKKWAPKLHGAYSRLDKKLNEYKRGKGNEKAREELRQIIHETDELYRLFQTEMHTPN